MTDEATNELTVTQPANQGGVGETKGGTDPSPVQPKNVTTDIRAAVASSGERYGDGTPAVFAGYPKTMYHPVFRARTANDPNEAAQMFQPPHNWFPTGELADMARTDREAQQALHHNLSVKVADKLAAANGEDAPSAKPENEGVVRNSNQAQTSLDAGTEPVI